jgi:hypothetical protein
MAKVTRKVATPKRKDLGNLIPDSLNEPPKEIGQYAILIYGEKGIGKTSLAAQFPGAFILQLEPRRRNLRVFQRLIKPCSLEELQEDQHTPWEEIKETIRQALEHPKVKTIVIDTVDRAYDACLIHHCFELGIPDPSALNDYGATWRRIKDDFEASISEVLFHPSEKGLIFISHAQLREVESKTETESYEIICPTCAPAAWKTLKAVCDFAFYYGYQKTRRVMYIRGDEFIWGACGSSEHFLSSDGQPLKVIPMGNSPEEAFKMFMAGFNNTLKLKKGE